MYLFISNTYPLGGFVVGCPSVSSIKTEGVADLKLVTSLQVDAAVPAGFRARLGIGRDGFGGVLVPGLFGHPGARPLYTSDAADDLLCVDLGGRRIIKKNIDNADTANNNICI